MKDKSPVSLTGHFTGQVWCENGFSPLEMGSTLGKLLYTLHKPAGWINERLWGQSLETLLLARHHLLDTLVSECIEQEGVTQIVEIASGLSSRSLRMLSRYPDHLSLYLEADLPDMVRWKQERLDKQPERDARHQLTALNILREAGPLSPESILSGLLDSQQKTLVITEGLVNYFDLEVIRLFWSRLHQTLSVYPAAWYLFEVWPALEAYQNHLTFRSLRKLIEWITRQTVPLHYSTNDTIQAGVRTCGYQAVEIHSPDLTGFQSKGNTTPIDCPFRVVKARV